MKARLSKYSWINKLSPVQLLIVFYIIAIILSTSLLTLPVAYQPGVSISFIDILFTAVSALSVTGLSTIIIAETFSTTGIFLIATILQLGAVGVMAISTLIWIILGKKIGLKERRLIMTDQNQPIFKGMVRLIKEIILLLFIVEALTFLVLGTYLLNYYPVAKDAYFHGFFAVISAVSNGGLDITGASMIPYNQDYFVQIIIMLLIIFGAIGFPVLIEVKSYFLAKRGNRKFMRFSLFTKLTLATFFLLVIVGAIFIYIFDRKGFFASISWHETIFYALFQSITTRSGGLSTMDVSMLSESNHLFMSFLMFIGASPSSAGGGIRTTTFALVLVFIIAYVRGKKNIHIFEREIYDEDIRKAITVMFMGILLMFSSILIITTIEDFAFMKILFEVTSAFGTVGLSLGITPELNTVSKIILMLLMFIGRVGIITFLFMFQRTRKDENFRYPKERIIIG